MKLCNPENCTGCAACLNACPRNAIEFLPDKEGFLRPSVHSEICLECGICTNCCPQLHLTELKASDFEKKVYACWHKDKRIRRTSTSGGAFFALAQYVIERGGVVYGAAFENFPVVKHVAAATINDLKRLQGSKYVQSEIGMSFRDVKSKLANGKFVLFSGTACQIDALKTYLSDSQQDTLITVDLVCHGVPSPKVFLDYVNFLNQSHKSRIVAYNFRSKRIGWYLHSTAITFENRRKCFSNFFKDPFFRGFLRNYFLRPSCHVCKYANLNRPADITLSDFWGYTPNRKDKKDCDYDKGVSMVMINTSSGEAFFNKAKPALVVWLRAVVDAVSGNHALQAPFKAAENRAEFWHDYQDMAFADLLNKYCYPEELSQWWLDRYTFKGRLRSKLRRIRLRGAEFVKTILKNARQICKNH